MKLRKMLAIMILVLLSVPSLPVVNDFLWLHFAQPTIPMPLGVNFRSFERAISVDALLNEPETSNVTGVVNRVMRSDGWSLNGGPSLTAGQVDAILESFNSPAKGTGRYFYEHSKRTGIDNAFVLAMFGLESTYGTNERWVGKKGNGTSHNVGNIRCHSNLPCYNGFVDYENWNEGIGASFDLLVSYREVRGHQDIFEALLVWAPPSENDVDLYRDYVTRMVTSWRSVHQAPKIIITEGVFNPIETVNISANFHTVNCAYWGNQPGCQHLGTDYVGSPGTKVIAPVDGTFLLTGFYPENTLMAGHYVMYKTYDGYELYLGHINLSDEVKRLSPGDSIRAGIVLGTLRGNPPHTFGINHTHVQLRNPEGALTDFEPYLKGKTPI